VTRLKDIKLPLEMGSVSNEITPVRKKWADYTNKKWADHLELGDHVASTVWEYVEMLHMIELILKWKSPKVLQLTPLALEVVAEIEEALKDITSLE
jgi:hypothetical protein